ncbi:holin [Paenibacillus xylanexedens]|uniref:holin n=1 Tax=Paenibacillus xylanexedens TaxID=528191 RepID=UPI001FD56C18|nr:holin [Paenibacillus xylanexedens]
MEFVLTFASVLAVFVLAAVQLVENTVKMPSNIVTVIGLLIGLLITAAYPFTTLDVTLRLWAGGLAG